MNRILKNLTNSSQMLRFPFIIISRKHKRSTRNIPGQKANDQDQSKLEIKKAEQPIIRIRHNQIANINCENLESRENIVDKVGNHEIFDGQSTQVIADVENKSDQDEFVRVRRDFRNIELEDQNWEASETSSKGQKNVHKIDPTCSENRENIVRFSIIFFLAFVQQFILHIFQFDFLAVFRWQTLRRGKKGGNIFQRIKKLHFHYIEDHQNDVTNQQINQKFKSEGNSIRKISAPEGNGIGHQPRNGHALNPNDILVPAKTRRNPAHHVQVARDVARHAPDVRQENVKFECFIYSLEAKK